MQEFFLCWRRFYAIKRRVKPNDKEDDKMRVIIAKREKEIEAIPVDELSIGCNTVICYETRNKNGLAIFNYLGDGKFGFIYMRDVLYVGNNIDFAKGKYKRKDEGESIAAAIADGRRVLIFGGAVDFMKYAITYYESSDHFKL